MAKKRGDKEEKKKKDVVKVQKKKLQKEEEAKEPVDVPIVEEEKKPEKKKPAKKQEKQIQKKEEKPVLKERSKRIRDNTFKKDMDQGLQDDLEQIRVAGKRPAEEPLEKEKIVPQLIMAAPASKELGFKVPDLVFTKSHLDFSNDPTEHAFNSILEKTLQLNKNFKEHNIQKEIRDKYGVQVLKYFSDTANLKQDVRNQVSQLYQALTNNFDQNYLINNPDFKMDLFKELASLRDDVYSTLNDPIYNYKPFDLHTMDKVGGIVSRMKKIGNDMLSKQGKPMDVLNQNLLDQENQLLDVFKKNNLNYVGLQTDLNQFIEKVFNEKNLNNEVDQVMAMGEEIKQGLQDIGQMVLLNQPVEEIPNVGPIIQNEMKEVQVLDEASALFNNHSQLQQQEDEVLDEEPSVVQINTFVNKPQEFYGEQQQQEEEEEIKVQKRKRRNILEDVDEEIIADELPGESVQVEAPKFEYKPILPAGKKFILSQLTQDEINQSFENSRAFFNAVLKEQEISAKLKRREIRRQRKDQKAAEQDSDDLSKRLRLPHVRAVIQGLIDDDLIDVIDVDHIDLNNKEHLAIVEGISASIKNDNDLKIESNNARIKKLSEKGQNLIERGKNDQETADKIQAIHDKMRELLDQTAGLKYLQALETSEQYAADPEVLAFKKMQQQLKTNQYLGQIGHSTAKNVKSRAKTYREEHIIRAKPFFDQQEQLLREFKTNYNEFLANRVPSQEALQHLDILRKRDPYSYLLTEQTDLGMVDTALSLHDTMTTKLASLLVTTDEAHNDAKQAAIADVKRRQQLMDSEYMSTRHMNYNKYIQNYVEPEFDARGVSNKQRAQAMWFPAFYKKRSMESLNDIKQGLPEDYLKFPQADEYDNELPNKYKIRAGQGGPTVEEAWDLVYGPLNQFIFRAADLTNVFTHKKAFNELKAEELQKISTLQDAIEKTFKVGPNSNDSIFSAEEVQDIAERLHFVNTFNYNSTGQRLTLRDVQAALQTELLEKFIRIFEDQNDHDLFNRRRIFYLSQMYRPDDQIDPKLKENNLLATPFGKAFVDGMFRKFGDIAAYNISSLGLPSSFPKDVYDDAVGMYKRLSLIPKEELENDPSKRGTNFAMFSGEKNFYKKKPYRLEDKRMTKFTGTQRKYDSNIESRRTALINSNPKLSAEEKKLLKANAKGSDAIALPGVEELHYQLYTDNRQGYPSIRRRAYEENFFATNPVPINFNIDAAFGVSLIVPRLSMIADRFIYLNEFQWSSGNTQLSMKNVDDVFGSNFNSLTTYGNPLTAMYDLYQKQLQPYKNYYNFRVRDKGIDNIFMPPLEGSDTSFYEAYNEGKKSFKNIVDARFEDIADYYKGLMARENLNEQLKLKLNPDQELTNEQVKQIQEDEMALAKTEEEETRRFKEEQDFCSMCFTNANVDKKYMQCCGRMMHEQCFPNMIIDQFTAYSDSVRSFQCVNCGFTPTGLVSDNRMSIYHERQRKKKPYDPQRESQRWIFKLNKLHESFRQTAKELNEEKAPFHYKFDLYEKMHPSVRQGKPLHEEKELVPLYNRYSKLHTIQLSDPVQHKNIREFGQYILPGMVKSLDQIFGYIPLKRLERMIEEDDEGDIEMEQEEDGGQDLNSKFSTYYHRPYMIRMNDETQEANYLKYAKEYAEQRFLKPTDVTEVGTNLLLDLISNNDLIKQIRVAANQMKGRSLLIKDFLMNTDRAKDGMIFAPQLQVVYRKKLDFKGYASLVSEDKKGKMTLALNVAKPQVDFAQFRNLGLRKAGEQQQQQQQQQQPLKRIQAEILPQQPLDKELAEAGPEKQRAILNEDKIMNDIENVEVKQEAVQNVQPQIELQEMIPITNIGHQILAIEWPYPEVQQSDYLAENEELKEDAEGRIVLPEQQVVPVQQEDMIIQQQQQQPVRKQSIGLEAKIDLQVIDQNQHRRVENSLMNIVNLVDYDEMRSNLLQNQLFEIDLFDVGGDDKSIQAEPFNQEMIMQTDQPEMNFDQGVAQMAIQKEKTASQQVNTSQVEVVGEGPSKDEMIKRIINQTTQQERKKILQLEQGISTAIQAVQQYATVETHMENEKDDIDKAFEEIITMSKEHNTVLRGVIDRMNINERQYFRMGNILRPVHEALLAMNDQKITGAFDRASESMDQLMSQGNALKQSINRMAMIEGIQSRKIHNKQDQIIQKQGQINDNFQGVRRLHRSRIQELNAIQRNLSENYNLYNQEQTKTSSILNQLKKIDQKINNIDFEGLKVNRDALQKGYDKYAEQLLLVKKNYIEQKEELAKKKEQRDKLDVEYTEFYNSIKNDVSQNELNALFAELPPTLNDYMDLPGIKRESFLQSVTKGITQQISSRTQADKDLLLLKNKLSEYANARGSIFADKKTFKDSIKIALQNQMSEAERNTHKLTDSDIDGLDDVRNINEKIAKVSDLSQRKKFEYEQSEQKFNQMNKLFQGVSKMMDPRSLQRKAKLLSEEGNKLIASFELQANLPDGKMFVTKDNMTIEDMQANLELMEKLESPIYMKHQSLEQGINDIKKFEDKLRSSHDELQKNRSSLLEKINQFNSYGKFISQNPNVALPKLNYLSEADTQSQQQLANYFQPLQSWMLETDNQVGAIKGAVKNIDDVKKRLQGVIQTTVTNGTEYTKQFYYNIEDLLKTLDSYTELQPIANYLRQTPPTMMNYSDILRYVDTEVNNVKQIMEGTQMQAAVKNSSEMSKQVSSQLGKIKQLVDKFKLDVDGANQNLQSFADKYGIRSIAKLPTNLSEYQTQDQINKVYKEVIEPLEEKQHKYTDRQKLTNDISNQVATLTKKVDELRQGYKQSMKHARDIGEVNSRYLNYLGTSQYSYNQHIDGKHTTAESQAYLVKLKSEYNKSETDFKALTQFAKELETLVTNLNSNASGWEATQKELDVLKEKIIPYSDFLVGTQDPKYAGFTKQQLQLDEQNKGIVEAYKPVLNEIQSYFDGVQKNMRELKTEYNNKKIEINKLKDDIEIVARDKEHLKQTMINQHRMAMELQAAKNAKDLLRTEYDAYYDIMGKQQMINATQDEKRKINNAVHDIKKYLESFDNMNQFFQQNQNNYSPSVQTFLKAKFQTLKKDVQNGIKQRMLLYNTRSQVQNHPMGSLIEKMVDWNQLSWETIVKRIGQLTSLARLPAIGDDNFQDKQQEIDALATRYMNDISKMQESLIHQDGYNQQLKAITLTLAINTHNNQDQELKNQTLQQFQVNSDVQEFYNSNLQLLEQKIQQIRNLSDNLQEAQFTFNSQGQQHFQGNLAKINEKLKQIGSNKQLKMVQDKLRDSSLKFLSDVEEEFKNNPNGQVQNIKKYLTESGLADAAMLMNDLFFSQYTTIFKGIDNNKVKENVNHATSEFVRIFKDNGYANLVDTKQIKQDMMVFFGGINDSFQGKIVKQVTNVVGINMSEMIAQFDKNKVHQLWSNQVAPEEAFSMIENAGGIQVRVENAGRIEQQIQMNAQQMQEEEKSDSLQKKVQRMFSSKEQSSNPSQQIQRNPKVVNPQVQTNMQDRIDMSQNRQQQEEIKESMRQQPPPQSNRFAEASANFNQRPPPPKYNQQLIGFIEGGNFNTIPDNPSAVARRLVQNERGRGIFSGLNSFQTNQRNRSIYDNPHKQTTLQQAIKESRSLPQHVVPQYQQNLLKVRNDQLEEKDLLEDKVEQYEVVTTAGKLLDKFAKNDPEYRSIAVNTLQAILRDVLPPMIGGKKYLANAQSIDDLVPLDKMKALMNILKYAPQITAAICEKTDTAVKEGYPIQINELERIKDYEIGITFAAHQCYNMLENNKANNYNVINKQQADSIEDVLAQKRNAILSSLLYMSKMIAAGTLQQEMILNNNIGVIDEVLDDMHAKDQARKAGQEANQKAEGLSDGFIAAVLNMIGKAGLKEMFNEDSAEGRQARQFAKQAAQQVAPRVYTTNQRPNVGGFGGQYNAMGPGVGMPGQDSSQHRYMMAYPGSQAVQGQQGGGENQQEGSGNQRLSSEALRLIKEELKISQEDIKFLQNIRFNPDKGRVQYFNPQTNEERDLTKEEKVRFVKIMIKIIVVMYAMSVEDVSESEKKRVGQKLEKKYLKEGVEGKMGKLFATVNKLADNIHKGVNQQ